MSHASHMSVVAAHQVLWLHYLERFRNLQYLEAQLDNYQRWASRAAWQPGAVTSIAHTIGAHGFACVQLVILHTSS